MKQRLGTSDDSSTCEHISGHPDLPSGDFNGRKRKCLAKDVHSAFAPPSIGRDIKSGKTNEERAKYYKVVEGTEKDDSKGKVEESNSAHAEESGPEHIKDNAKSSLVSVKQDYIHVRARRGQATDSHSLAERVRREKISERMKFLQGLVPGCSKITGKAVMLDEIINYVQSLQRQVEFLSMKLAAVNPRLDLNLEGGNLAQDLQMFQPHCSFGSKPFAPDDTVAYAQLQKSHMQVGFGPHAGRHAVGNQAEVAAGRMRTPLPSTNGCEDPELQISNVWDDELQSAFPMGLEKNRNTHFTSQGVNGMCKVCGYPFPSLCLSWKIFLTDRFGIPSLAGSLTTDHMKVEL